MGGDNFISTLFKVFGGVIILLVVGLIIFNALKVEYGYNDFQHLSNFQAIDDMPEDQYLVYYYGENCGHCTLIKEQVLRFANKNEAGIKVYLMDSANTSGVNTVVHPDTGKEMTGTPSMITVVDGVIVDLNVGSEAIPELLDAINEGTYTEIN